MKRKYLIILLVIIAVILLTWYGYNNGWFGAKSIITNASDVQKRRCPAGMGWSSITQSCLPWGQL